jgi:predicted DNA-binding transcriptional regulator YafY
MSRAARLLHLMEMLRRHRQPVRGQALAAELGISLRSLYRDIATLQGQGAAIEGEPGIGYVLRPGFTLPPLMFSEDEVEALVLGSRWVAEHSDPALQQAARAALARIGAVLPPALRAGLDDNGLLVGPARVEAEADLGLLRAAIRQEQKLDIAYRDAAGQRTQRLIWPFALGFFERVRVVAAWCELRQDLRSFRVDRIDRLEPAGERYPRRRAALLRDWRAREGITADRN